ncbi:MAG: ABC transporter permease [Treponemataceae bacterium]
MERFLQMSKIVLPAVPATIYMVFVSASIALLFGIPLGIILYITREGGLRECRGVYRLVDGVVNFFRSLPAVIIMLLAIPLSRLIIGKAIGSTAAIVPLCLAATPFVARLMEGYFLEVDEGVIEAALSMGSTTSEIIFRVLISEAAPSIVNGITMTLINLVGLSAMAGMLGGGGLGDIAIRYGYQRFQFDMLWYSVIIIILIVQGIQVLGTFIARKIKR